MKAELEPAAVARRLHELRALYVAESVDDGRRRLRDEARGPAAFASAVDRRLGELRALDALTRYLHDARRDHP